MFKVVDRVVNPRSRQAHRLLEASRFDLLGSPDRFGDLQHVLLWVVLQEPRTAKVMTESVRGLDLTEVVRTRSEVTPRGYETKILQFLHSIIHGLDLEAGTT